MRLRDICILEISTSALKEEFGREPTSCNGAVIIRERNRESRPFRLKKWFVGVWAYKVSAVGVASAEMMTPAGRAGRTLGENQRHGMEMREEGEFVVRHGKLGRKENWIREFGKFLLQPRGRQ